MTGEQDDETHRFDKLYRSTVEHLHNYARVATGGDRSQAHTLVQETFKAAWQARQRLLDLEWDHQRAWLFRVLKNKIVDAYRRGAAKPEVPMDHTQLHKHGRLTRSTPSVAGVLLKGVLAQCWEAIKDMPEVRRKVFYLRAHEWKSSEIAAHLRITSSTVRDHVKAGLLQLNEKIGSTREIFADLEDDEYENGTE